MAEKVREFQNQAEAAPKYYRDRAKERRSQHGYDPGNLLNFSLDVSRTLSPL